jgi:hypothetical protein
MDSGRYWEGAIRDKLVSGEFSTTSQIRSATVTSSSEDLRKVVRRHHGATFADTPVLELTRD